jgi:hypothetical protein
MYRLFAEFRGGKIQGRTPGPFCPRKCLDEGRKKDKMNE